MTGIMIDVAIPAGTVPLDIGSIYTGSGRDGLGGYAVG
jgi:hypothetical protein